jgi:hypothetical protein
MLSPIGTKKLLTLSRSMQQDIRDMKIYGEYIFTHDLVDTNGDVNLDAVDPQGYQVYLRSHRRENGKALQAAVRLELNTRVSEKQARLTLKSALLQSLDALSNTSKMTGDEPPTCNEDSIHPRRVSLDTPPPPHVPSASPTPTGAAIGIQDYAKTDHSTEVFLRKLDYADDEPADLLHMVTPTKEELESPMRPEATFLTPAHGSPATDPAYKSRLQNPDMYGAIAKTKQLPMISSKFQWNGKRNTFDEVKRLVEGHFEGYGGAYLVNRKFITVYIEHGYKVLRFFPRIRLGHEDLEKQNGTLYGSLKQICRKGAASAILRRHEQKRDGMRTWYELLTRFDNMGSNDVMTIYYDEVISRPYHQKYPGGLEQFAADYEEAYTELAVIGETHTDTEKRRKLLTNLYDPSDPETRILVSYCERNCPTFDDIIRHLTDTHVRDTYYNARHSARKAKMSSTTIADSGPDADDDTDIRMLLKTIRERSTLPDDYKIPSKAWQILTKVVSKEDRDAFE